MSKKIPDFAASTYPLPGNNNGGGGGTGPTGPTGPGGGASYLPANPPPDSSNNTLSVDASGNEAWQPVGGYNIQSFSISGSGVANVVEVGSTQAVINWSATYNFTPISITVTCTGQPTQTPAPSGGSSSGTFTGPFTSDVNGTVIAVQITVIDPVGAPHVANATMTYAAKIVFGSVVAGSEVAGQALWNTLNAAGSVLRSTRGGSYPYASPFGFDQAFGLLSSLGTPTMKDPNGNVVSVVLIGSATISENATPQTVSFYTVGSPGASTTYTMS